MKTGLFTFETNNLGDEMQSLAVLNHLKKIDCFLDRDHLANAKTKEETLCVFNSWFLIGDDFRSPAAEIKPIFYGFHLGRPELLKGEWFSYLKKHEPIGCRDLYTVEKLKEAGIQSFWTGCLTLFLGRYAPPRTQPRKGIYFIDVPPEAEPFLPKFLREKAIRLSTFPTFDTRTNPLKRWAMLGRLVEIISHAELVITRRLHAALPAASFGTPVVAIPDPRISWARDRFSGFETLIPTIFLDELEKKIPAIDWNNLPPVCLPECLEENYKNFKETLRKNNVFTETPALKSPLEKTGIYSQNIKNIRQIELPGRIRFALDNQFFDQEILLWTDRTISIACDGFPGLEKFAFRVQVCSRDTEAWEDWGFLKDLVL